MRQYLAADAALRALLVVVALVGAASLAACGSDGAASDEVDTLTISNVRSLPTSSGISLAAVYFDMASPVDDELIGASTSEEVGAGVAMRRTMTDDADGMGAMPNMDHTSDEGMAMMEALTSVSLGAGETVSFEPGEMHLMIEDLVRPLAAGDTFEITLTFAAAGQRTVDVNVTNDI